MPHLHEILSSIHRLENAVAIGERKLANTPEDLTIAAIISTSAKLLRKKRAEYEVYLKTFNAEPVTYSVYKGRGLELPQLREVCAAFTSFETAVLLTAQAKLLDQPQLIRRLERPISAAALRYGYLASTNPKHLAFVAATQGVKQLELQLNDPTKSLPRGDPKRLVRVPDKVIMEAARDIASLASISTKPDKLAKFSEQVGPAILVEVNDWCEYHTKALMDLETIWGNENAGGMALHAAAHQLENLQHTIEKLSDDVRYETFEVTGAFYSINTKTRRFAFDADDGRYFGGHFPTDMFNKKRPAKLPRRYKVIFKKKSRVNQALGTEVVTNEIAAYEEIR